jgi:DNA-binding CsgD family transcriptional regulator
MSDEVRPEEIYEALFDDDAFANLPQLLARAGAGRSAVMQWSHADGETQALAYSYYSPDYVAAYADGFVGHDLWLDAATRPETLNRTINGSDHLSSAAFERSVLYNDYSRAHGDDTFFSIGSAMSSSNGTGLITVGRGRLQSPFEPEDVARLDRVIRSARQVLRVRGELAAAKRQAAIQRSTSESVGLCLLTIRRDGYVLDLNAAAELALKGSSIFRIVNGCLQAVRQRDADALTAALTAATRCAGPIGSTFPIEPSGAGRRIGVAVTPLASSGTSAALLAFRLEGSRTDLALQLRQVYGLTRMEAELAVSMHAGRSQREHAEARGVLESTIRSQLKSLTAKMGCRRQAEVVALIANLPPAPPGP